jgi:hypothetical protein
LGTNIFYGFSPLGVVSNNDNGYMSSQFLNYLITNQSLPASWTVI